jgi:hypothetical protein
MSDTHDTTDTAGYPGQATFLRRHLPIVGFVIIWASLALHIMALSQTPEGGDWPAGVDGQIMATTNVLMVLSLPLLSEWLRQWFARLESELSGVSLSVWIFWMFACYFYDVSYGHGAPAAVLCLVFCVVYAGDAGLALGHPSAGTQPARSVAVRGTRRRVRDQMPNAEVKSHWDVRGGLRLR